MEYLGKLSHEIGPSHFTCVSLNHIRLGLKTMELSLLSDALPYINYKAWGTTQSPYRQPLGYKEKHLNNEPVHPLQSGVLILPGEKCSRVRTSAWPHPLQT